MSILKSLVLLSFIVTFPLNSDGAQRGAKAKRGKVQRAKAQRVVKPQQVPGYNQYLNPRVGVELWTQGRSVDRYSITKDSRTDAVFGKYGVAKLRKDKCFDSIFNDVIAVSRLPRIKEKASDLEKLYEQMNLISGGARRSPVPSDSVVMIGRIQKSSPTHLLHLRPYSSEVDNPLELLDSKVSLGSGCRVTDVNVSEMFNKAIEYAKGHLASLQESQGGKKSSEPERAD